MVGKCLRVPLTQAGKRFPAREKNSGRKNESAEVSVLWRNEGHGGWNRGMRVLQPLAVFRSDIAGRVAPPVRKYPAGPDGKPEESGRSAVLVFDFCHTPADLYDGMYYHYRDVGSGFRISAQLFDGPASRDLRNTSQIAREA